jgi:hypothetical protein
MVDTSKFEKEFKLLLVMAFIIVLAQSALQVDFPTLEDYENLYSSDYSTQDYTAQTAKTALENSMMELLTDYDIVCENISVDVNITDDTCITINKVHLSVDDFTYAKQLLLENFGELEIVEE